MNATNSVRRRPDSGGYARGEETRARIIEAAVEVFGTEGFERASTRQIAAQAGVNPPALQYYFDSKEGLHRACAQAIVARVQEALVPALRIAADADGSGDRRRAAEVLCDMLDALADMVLTTPNAAGWKRFLARAQADGAGPGIELVRDGMVRPLHEACARLVGVAIGQPPEAEATRLRTVLVLSQLNVLHTGKTNALCILGWSDYDKERLAKVKAAIRTHTLSALLAEATQ
jgi:AcrR family transcriptional regulator